MHLLALLPLLQPKGVQIYYLRAFLAAKKKKPDCFFTHNSIQLKARFIAKLLKLVAVL